MDQPQDLVEMEVIGKIKYERCLHKGIITKNKIIIIGGVNFDHAEIVNKTDFSSIPMPATANLTERAAEVSYNGYFFKKCSTC